MIIVSVGRQELKVTKTIVAAYVVKVPQQMRVIEIIQKEVA